MNYIGGLGNIGTVRRVEAAMSTNNKYILLWTRTYDINDGRSIYISRANEDKS